MAGTNGTLLAVFNGPTVYQAFTRQENDPDFPGPDYPGSLDYLQIIQAGGAVILQVKQSDEDVVVNTYPESWSKTGWMGDQQREPEYDNEHG